MRGAVMYVSINVLWLTLTALRLTVQDQSAKFRVYKELDISPGSGWSPFLYARDVASMVVCASMCLSDQRCAAAVFDKSLKECQLATCPLNNYVQSSGTDLVYIDIGEVHSEGEVISRNVNTGVYIDCQEAFESGQRCSGIFTIKKPNPSATPFEAFCEFDNEHGWTVIQRRLDGSVDFYRGWDDYVNGFGDVDGEYWIGLENIHYLTDTNTQLRVYLEDHEGETREANYSSFSIGSSSSKYTITVSGYTGDAGNSLPTGAPFSTKDQDNDSHSPSSCAISYGGAWWYTGCHNSNLNGVWYSDGGAAGYARGLVWNHWMGYHYSLKADTMMVTR